MLLKQLAAQVPELKDVGYRVRFFQTTRKGSLECGNDKYRIAHISKPSPQAILEICLKSMLRNAVVQSSSMLKLRKPIKNRWWKRF